MAEKMETIMRWSPLDIPTLVRAHWESVPKEPLNFIGEPSTVKSTNVLNESKRIASDIGKEFVEWNRIDMAKKQEVLQDTEKYFVFADLRASETDIGELRLQDMQASERFITFKYNILFEVLSKPQATGILFFDEMNLAPNMIKAQFYKIINDHSVGDIPLSENVLCISAGNEAEHARGVTEDPVPLVLRRSNYFIRPLTTEEYLDYAMRTEHHRWVTGYLGFQPGDGHKVKYDLPESVGQPCARTWTKLSNVLIANEKRLFNIDLSGDAGKRALRNVEMVATGFVGQAVAKKFTAYVKSARNVDLKEILKNPSKVKEYERDEDLSMLYAVMSGIVDLFAKNKKVFDDALKVSLEIERPELGVFMLRGMKSADRRGFEMAAAKAPQALMSKMIDRYEKYLVRNYDE